jgi:hypothetical protein
MDNPTASELIESVIETVQAMGLQITLTGGILTLVGHRNAATDSPVRFMITDEELLRYFHSVAADVDEANAWTEWRMLISAHLAETLYELENIHGPAMIVIDETGFRASPTTNT